MLVWSNEDIMCVTDWNTHSDEDAVPELRQVSCAALACLLKHTGLSSLTAASSRYGPLCIYGIHADLH